MADFHSAADAPKARYKDKLLQKSNHDELSHPDQAPKPKLPPTKDEGSPPMTIKLPAGHQAEAPAGEAALPPAGEQRTSSSSHSASQAKPAALRSSSSSLGTPWSPKGSTQSAIDARFRFQHSLSGRKASVKADYVLKEGVTPVMQPQHIDDHPSDEDVPQPEGWEQQCSGTEPTDPAAASPSGADSAAGPKASQEDAQINIAQAGPTTVAGTTLSDVEQQVISDPSTADLVAAATQDAAAVVNPEPPKANVVVVQPGDSAEVAGMQGEVSAVMPAPGAAAATPIVTAADTAAAAAGKASRDSGDSSPTAVAAGSDSNSGSAGRTGAAAATKRAQSTVGGEISGVPIRIREATDTAASSMQLPEEAADVDRNAPCKAFGMETERTLEETRSSSDSSANRADSLFTGGGRIFTASDAAAAGLADLETEADAAAESGVQEGRTSGDTSANDDTMDDYTTAAETAGECGTLGDTATGGIAAGTMSGTTGDVPGDTAGGAAVSAGDRLAGTLGDTKPAESVAIRAPGTPDSMSKAGAAQQGLQQDALAAGAATGSTAAGEVAQAAQERADVAEGSNAADDTADKSGGGLNPLKAVIGGAISKMADIVMGPDVAADLDLPGSDAEDKQQADSDEAAAELQAEGPTAPTAV